MLWLSIIYPPDAFTENASASVKGKVHDEHAVKRVYLFCVLNAEILNILGGVQMNEERIAVEHFAKPPPATARASQ